MNIIKAEKRADSIAGIAEITGNHFHLISLGDILTIERRFLK